MDPSTLTRSKAAARVKKPEGFEEAKAMAYDPEPDQRDCGGVRLSGFLGPTGLNTRGLTEAETRAVAPLNTELGNDLARVFVADDVLTPMLARGVRSSVGERPRLTFEPARELRKADPDAEDPALREAEKPTPEEAALIAELAPVVEWTEAKKTGLHRLTKQAARAVRAFGTGFLRPYVPAARLAEDTAEIAPGVYQGTGTFSLGETTIAGAIQHMRAEVLLPDRATVDEDEDTGLDTSVVTFGERGTGTDRKAASAEVSFVAPEAPDASASGASSGASASGADALTTVRILSDGEDASEASYALRGRPLLVKVEDEEGALIDAAARRMQQQINTKTTERAIVLDKLSFPRYVLLGADPPGTFVEEGEGADKRVVFKPDPNGFAAPPGDIMNVSGQATYAPEAGPDGQPVVTGRVPPRLGTLDAADPVGLQKAAGDWKRALLERSNQAWVLTTGESDVSGVSRTVAMEDYLADAERFAAIMEEAAQTFVELAVDYAADLAGQPGRYHGIRARVEFRVQRPGLTSEEMTATINAAEKKAISWARARQRMGVDDSAQEDRDIEAEQAARAEWRAQEAGSLFGAFPAPPAASGDGAAGRAPTDPADLDPQLTPEA